MVHYRETLPEGWFGQHFFAIKISLPYPLPKLVNLGLPFVVFTGYPCFMTLYTYLCKLFGGRVISPTG
jgi:hypothetical protein